MTRREMKQRIRELERRVGELEESPWRFIPPTPYVPIYPEPCCPYLNKCTYCPHRFEITWGDNTSTGTVTWNNGSSIQVSYTS